MFDHDRVNIESAQVWVASCSVLNTQATRLASQYVVNEAYVYGLRQHPRERIIWLNKGLEACSLLSDNRDIKQNVVAFLGNLGLAYYALGMMSEAISYYDRAIPIAREIGGRQQEGLWLGNLGNSYRGSKRKQEAQTCYEQALAIAKETGDLRHEDVWLRRLGDVYQEHWMMCKAICRYQRALRIARKIGDRRGEGPALRSLSSAMYKLGNRDMAIELAEASLKVPEAIEDPSTPEVRSKLAEWQRQL